MAAMSAYQLKRQEAERLTVGQIEHQILCEEGQVRAGYGTNGTQMRIQALKDELTSRVENGAIDSFNDERESEETIEYPFEYRVAMKYRTLFDSASRRKKEFNLSLADVKKLMLRKTCAYTGVTLSSDPLSSNSRTIDRLDPSKGYVKGNVYAVTKRSNDLKNTLFERVGGEHRVPLSEVAALCSTISKLGFIEREL